jgi:hypothetical protein
MQIPERVGDHRPHERSTADRPQAPTSCRYAEAQRTPADCLNKALDLIEVAHFGLRKVVKKEIDQSNATVPGDDKIGSRVSWWFAGSARYPSNPSGITIPARLTTSSAQFRCAGRISMDCTKTVLRHPRLAVLAASRLRFASAVHNRIQGRSCRSTVGYTPSQLVRDSGIQPPSPL